VKSENLKIRNIDKGKKYPTNIRSQVLMRNWILLSFDVCTKFLVSMWCSSVDCFVSWQKFSLYQALRSPGRTVCLPLKATLMSAAYSVSCIKRLVNVSSVQCALY
jgi:hypothetical protein